MKQASEFGLTRGGRIRMATLLVQIPDVVALGHATCEGMVFTDSYYWDMSDSAPSWPTLPCGAYRTTRPGCSTPASTARRCTR